MAFNLFKRKKKFTESDNTAVFTTKFVLNDKKDITLVYHFAEDGAWQFSSNDEFDNYEEVARIVGLGQIVSLDESVLEVADLPRGNYAYRESKNDKWKIKPISE